MPPGDRSDRDDVFRPSHALPPLPPELDPRGKHRGGAPGSSGSGQLRHGLVWGARVISVIVAVSLLAGFAYEWRTYRNFNKGLTRLSIVTGVKQQGHKDIDGKDQNILIVGNDDRSDATTAELAALGTGPDGGSLNTDTMMIVHIPANGTSATLISLPRDSYVAIPGYGMNKLNAAYPDGYTAASGTEDAKRAAGADLLIKTIYNLTGLTMDHFVEVDLIGFYRISEAVGGITVNMCAAVRDPDSGINLPKGISTIKGKQALAFVRQRYGFANGLGDLDRVERQRYFLTAAFRQLTSAGILLKLQKLLTAVQSSIYVDSGLNLITLAGQLENLSANNIVGQTIPFVKFADENIGGSSQSVEIVDPVAVKQFVNKLLGTANSALAKAKAVAPSTVTVDVINGGTTDGAAKTNATTLQQDGFKIGDYTQPHAPSSATLIEYSSGMEAQAKTLAAYVPGASYQVVSGLSHVTLLLGTDGLAAKYIAPSTTTPTTTTPAVTPTTPKPKPIDSGCIN
jgi:LCP family protein required for cell wall assembly